MSDTGLENTKYKLIKSDDKLILTDKKTLKARVLDIDDIDYVVDDNQRLRDPNVIENYFRLKDEPYEPRMMTKTADYVKEQKEVEKLYSPLKYEDLIDEFIKKYAMTLKEIERLGLIPDESTIKNLPSRTEDDKKAMINDFKLLKKKLTENKNLGTDIFTYLKNYFINYHYNMTLSNLYEELSINSYLKKKVFYKNTDDYNKIKNSDNLKSLKDISDNGINIFGGINLKLLKELIDKFKAIKKIYTDKNKSKYVMIDNTTSYIRNSNVSYNLNIIPNKEESFKSKGGGKVEDLIEIYNKLGEEEKQLFNDWTSVNSFEGYSKSVESFINEKKEYSDELKKLIEDLKPEDYDAFRELKNKDIKEDKEDIKEDKQRHITYNALFVGPLNSEDSEKIERVLIQENTVAFLSIYNMIISGLLKRINELENTKGTFTKMNELIDDITDKGLEYFNTTVKIQVVVNILESRPNDISPYSLKAWLYTATQSKENITKIDKPKMYESGHFEYVSTTKSIIRNNKNKVVQEFVENIAKEILQIVIERINDNNNDSKFQSSEGPLKMSSGWTDDTLTRIENITEKLKNISNSNYNHGHGKINPALLRVMNRTSSGWNNQSEGPLKMSAGWTDDTLTRIDRINDTLKMSSGWTDDTLTRIENITEKLKMY